MTDEAPPPPKRHPTFWRTERGQKFVREVGSVVLGVLIALALGAVATEIGWRIEVFRTRLALADELGEVIGQAQERLKVRRCVETRLDQLAAIVDSAAETGRLPPLGEIGQPAFRTWTRGVWDNAVSAETAAHFEQSDQDNLSAIYEFVSLINTTDQRVLDIWTKLHGMIGPGRKIGEEEIAQLRDTIGQARLSERVILMSGLRIQQVADAFQLPYSRDTVRQYADRDRSKDAICQPIGANPPAHYGQAPLAGIVENVRAHPITHDDAGK